MRTSLTVTLVAAATMALPSLAQVTGGRETVQDAIRFERQKDAAAARQARIEARGGERASADRSEPGATRARNSKTRKSHTGSAARSSEPGGRNGAEQQKR